MTTQPPQVEAPELLAKPDDTAWLIEMSRNDAPVPRYWNHSKFKAGWVWDANEAMRFCREQDARDFLDGLQMPLQGRPVEHVFLTRSGAADILARSSVEPVSNHYKFDVCPTCGALPCDWVNSPATPDERIAGLVSALEKGADWFDEYAEEHKKKARQASDSYESASRSGKAKRNQERADFFRQALATFRETDRG